MKKRLLTMLILMLVAIGTLYTLNATSNAPNRAKNGFTRNFLPIESSIANELEFINPVRELAGQKGDSLFLMTGEPGKVYVTNSRLIKPSIIALDNPKIQSIVPRFYTAVQYPEIYILGGNAIEYAVGDLTTGRTQKQRLSLHGIFNNPVLVNDKIIMQIIDGKTLNAYFAVVGKNGAIERKDQHIFESKGDAGFKNGGLLRYDSFGNRLIYIHYFDNGFDIFSPDLAMIRRVKTIDTIFNNPTEIAVNGKSVTYKHPPVRINTYAATYGGHVYISSLLLADNEKKSEFYSNTVIDKYDVANGKYVGSFYLPQIKDSPINQFYFLSENQILAFSEKNVAIININQKSFAKAHELQKFRPAINGKKQAVNHNPCWSMKSVSIG